MNYQDPIAIGCFALMVLTMVFSAGRNLGYDQGYEVADSSAFAEGHVAGWQEAMLQRRWFVVSSDKD